MSVISSMPTPREGNRSYLLRLWLPALAFIAFLLVIFVAALTSGDPDRVVPVAIALPVGLAAWWLNRWTIRRRMDRMFRSPDPTRQIRWFESTIRRSRVAHGPLFAASNAATILALYGRFDEAESALQSVSWQNAPPIVLAIESTARAVLAYARGALTDGLDYATEATLLGITDSAFPGSQTSELALRTHRNLGLALAGRATATTGDELRTALTRLPPLGQLLAAWGLAAIAKQNGDEQEREARRQLIAKRAPHFAPVLASIA
jgi:hypothetical protein